MRIQATTIRWTASFMCLAVQLTNISIFGVWGSTIVFHGNVKCFPYLQIELTPRHARLETNENKTFQRRLWNIVPVLCLFPLSLKPRRALSHHKTKSWFSKRSFRHSFHFFRVESMDLRYKITITSTCMQPRFRFLVTMKQQRFFLVLSCFCCYEPGKAGSTRKEKQEKLKQRKV